MKGFCAVCEIWTNLPSQGMNFFQENIKNRMYVVYNIVSKNGHL